MLIIKNYFVIESMSSSTKCSSMKKQETFTLKMLGQVSDGLNQAEHKLCVLGLIFGIVFISES